MRNTQIYPKFFSYQGLKGLFVLNVITTILHYIDNVIFFEHYPEPTWLNAHLVDMFWFVMTPVAGFALGWFKQHKNPQALLTTFIYVAMSILVLGHYRYQPFHHIGFKIHVFIWLEVIAAFALALYASGYVLLKKY